MAHGLSTTSEKPRSRLRCGAGCGATQGTCRPGPGADAPASSLAEDGHLGQGQAFARVGASGGDALAVRANDTLDRQVQSLRQVRAGGTHLGPPRVTRPVPAGPAGEPLGRGPGTEDPHQGSCGRQQGPGLRMAWERRAAGSGGSTGSSLTTLSREPRNVADGGGRWRARRHSRRVPELGESHAALRRWRDPQGGHRRLSPRALGSGPRVSPVPTGQRAGGGRGWVGELYEVPRET